MPTKADLSELFWRSFWTFAKVFLGGLTLAGTGAIDVEAYKVAAIAAAGSVLGLVQVFAAQQLERKTAGAGAVLGGTATGTGQ